nr:F-box/LRR-repeat protein 15-like isoform X3 [Physcomitrium patens]|eukprot:XP_024377895.1 F-box/LRR-repeat protein 15-like isoform X3 [Physcomitrella patens]
MAAHDSSVGRAWVLSPPDESVMSGGEIDGLGSSGLTMGLSPFVRQSSSFGGESLHNDTQIATVCLPSGDKLKGVVQSDTEDGNVHRVMPESTKVSCDPFSMSLPLRSPSTWGSTASGSSSCGESSMMNESEGCDRLLPLGEPLALQGTEKDVGFEVLAAHLSVSRLKEKLDDAGEISAVQGSTTRFRDLLRRGSGSLPPSSSNSMEGLPLQGASVGLDANLLHAETQGMLQAIRDVDMRMGAELSGGHGPFDDLQQRPVSVHSRTDLIRLRFPEKTPDKLHRKRAKIHPPSYTLRRQQRNMLASGSQGENSTTASSGASAGMCTQGFPPSTLPADASSSQVVGHLINPDLVGDDGDDGSRRLYVMSVEDGEARMDLTDDLLHKVFSFLRDVDLCQAGKVCRQWRVASTHEDFWKSLNFESRQVTHQQVTVLCARYPKATELNLKGCPCVDEVLVHQAMVSLRNLKVLTLGRGFLSDGFFYLLSGSESLQSLSITDATLGSGGAQEIQLKHESLRYLQVVKCRVLRIAIRCPLLETLSLKQTGTASAMLHCPRLLKLDVSSCHKLSDAGVRAAATACALLTSLDISNCAYVSDETLRELSLACSHLRRLDASYCPNISLEGVRMPMLTDLKLVNCEGINSSSMAALSYCVMLEVLAMDYCWLLTSVTLDLPRLRSISIGHNRKFGELTLRSPALTSLNLSHCPALSRIDIASSSFEKLCLKNQMGLSSMALQCPWLREVDLTECESLNDSVCDVFSDGGGCPKLNSLTLDYCDGLVKVKLTASSLRALSLVGCRNMISLELSCPVLQSLLLDGCNRLVAASFSPVGLMALNLGICPHLATLEIEASQMTTLDLRGCGALSQAFIRCPHLSSLDASYCSHLGDDCLAATTASCPAIQVLVLAACPAVGPVGLLALKKLPRLTMLDLSYTFLTDLSPIFEACPHLKVLRLSACKYLQETALNALHGGKVLSELQELDMSYGSLGRGAIEGVLSLCPHLTQLSLNGCFHVTDHLWSRLSTPPLPLESMTSEDTRMEDACSSDGVVDQSGRMDHKLHQDNVLETLREVTPHKKEMMEGCGQVETAQGHQAGACYVAANTLSDSRLKGPSEAQGEHDTDEDQWVSENDGSYPQTFVPMTGPARLLQTLNCVGCPNIQTVVIQRDAACHHLTTLNLSLSGNIREVRLGCSNLTTLNLSQCSALVVLELNCPRLITLCLQYCGIAAEMLEHALRGCSLLETLDVRNCPKVSTSVLTCMRSICPGLKRLYSTSSA